MMFDEVMRDSRLSARAKGVLAYLMTLPDVRGLQRTELCEHFSEGRDAICRAFSELEIYGAVVGWPVRAGNGKMNGWEYEMLCQRRKDEAAV